MKSVLVDGTKNEFNVNSIFCVGKNYIEHIKEFGSDDIPDFPVIFIKPNSSLIANRGVISIPTYKGSKISEEMHYEAELVIAVGKTGIDVQEKDASEYIFGYAIGLDMTLRDVQSKAKKDGMPWTTAKGFRSSAAVSSIIPVNKIADPMNLEFRLLINDELKQFTNTKFMIFNIYKIISYISSVFTVTEGDLIFTGTPFGVGKVITGDRITAELINYVSLNVNVL